jgi:hypothetical protein
MLQRDGDGMVSLLIVRLGVLVGGVGAGHPAAGQAEPQRHPVTSAVKALQTAGRLWLDRAGGRDVVAQGAVEVAARMVCSCIEGARLGWDVANPSKPAPSRAGNEQAEFSSSCGLISDTERILPDGTSGLSEIWLGD